MSKKSNPPVKGQERKGPMRPELLPIPGAESGEAYNAEYPIGDRGSWTSDPIPDEFYDELYDLLRRYGGRDCDGDDRLRAVIVDRKFQEAMHFKPIDNGGDSLEGAMKELDGAMYNHSIAAERLSQAWRMMQYWRDQEKQKKQGYSAKKG